MNNNSSYHDGAEAFKQLLEQRRAQLQENGIHSSVLGGGLANQAPPPPQPQPFLPQTQTTLHTQYSSLQYQQFLQQMPSLPSPLRPPGPPPPPMHLVVQSNQPHYISQPSYHYYLPSVPYTGYPLPGQQMASSAYLSPSTIPTNPYYQQQQPVTHHQLRQHHQKQKQPKAHPPPPPSSSSSGISVPHSLSHPSSVSLTQQPDEEYYCEPCDKSFKKLFDFQAHSKTHEKCSHPDCSFFASKKVVQAHYLSRHGEYAGNGYKLIDVEGQKFNLLLGYSPEEIEEWKKERRNKFPTKERVKEKQEHETCLETAGGILPTSSRKQNKNKKGKGKQGDKEHNDNLIGKKRRFEAEDLTSSQSAVALKSNDYQEKRENNKKRTKLTVPPPLEGGKRGSLLRKLLSDQIEQEENLLLQCIRFVCENNFFCPISHVDDHSDGEEDLNEHEKLSNSRIEEDDVTGREKAEMVDDKEEVRKDEREEPPGKSISTLISMYDEEDDQDDDIRDEEDRQTI